MDRPKARVKSTTHDGWGACDNLPLRESHGSHAHVQAATLVVTVVDLLAPFRSVRSCVPADAYMPGMDALLELERLNEGETPTNITDPAVWVANLLEYRRGHDLDPALDAGVWLAWAKWSLSRLRYRAAYADAQAALELRPGWPPAVELRRRIELRAGTHGLL